LRTSRPGAAGSVSEAPQAGQNVKSAGFSRPQEGQLGTGGAYAARPAAAMLRRVARGWVGHLGTTRAGRRA
jgi:hypothetical protein